MKSEYENTLLFVQDVINNLDPMGLLKQGAPKDEYNNEIQQIVSGLRMCNTIEDIQQLVYKVFKVGQRNITIVLILFFLGFSFCESGISEAREDWQANPAYLTPQRYDEKNPLAPRNTFEIVPETFWYHYEEPTISIKDEAVMYGIRASYTRHKEPPINPFMYRLEGRYGAGRVHYDGSLSDGTPHKDEGSDYIYEVRGVIGYDTEIREAIITPFIGLGFRYLYDKLESRFAYERNIRYLYIPVGVESAAFLNQNWVWGIRAEYDLLVRGWVKSHLSDVTPLFNDIENVQHRGTGARGSFYLKREINDKMSLSIEPFVRYWGIDDSDTAPRTFAGTLIGGGYEPKNWTLESGLQISLIF